MIKPPSISPFSNDSTSVKNDLYCLWVQKPITFSTPSRLYQLLLPAASLPSCITRSFKSEAITSFCSLTNFIYIDRAIFFYFFFFFFASELFDANWVSIIFCYLPFVSLFSTIVDFISLRNRF